MDIRILTSSNNISFSKCDGYKSCFIYSLTCLKFKSQFQIQSKHDHGVKSHKCSECDYASSQADVVRSHVIAHSGEKSQKCNKCEYLVSHANTLKVHMKIHPGENDVKCNICPSMLHEEYTVKRKSFEVKSHKCNQCEYISHKSNNSTWAMSIHSKEKPFE